MTFIDTPPNDDWIKAAGWQMTHTDDELEALISDVARSKKLARYIRRHASYRHAPQPLRYAVERKLER